MLRLDYIQFNFYILTLYFITMIDIVFAAQGTFDATQVYEMDDVIRVAISIIILFSWVLAVFFIIWGWVMLILSGWKEDKVKPAVNSIKYAVVWLIVIILSVFLTPKLWNMLGLNVSKYVSPDIIFTTIKDLSNKFFWTKDTIEFDSWSSSDTLPSDFSDL